MPVKVEFSTSVTEAIGQNAERRRKRLERNFNRGMKELSEGSNKSAKALYDNNQTIRIVCEAGEEGKKVLEEHKAEFVKGTSALMGEGPALTFGDFNEDGTPKKDGTTIIVIDNEIAAQGDLADPIIKMLGGDVSYYQILIHELLHATNKKRTHGNDGSTMYDEWVEDFEEAVDRVKLKEHKEKMMKKPFDWRTGALPDFFRNPVVLIAALLVGLFGCCLCLLLIGFLIKSYILPPTSPESEQTKEIQDVQETEEMPVTQEMDELVLNDISFSQVDWYGTEDDVLLADSLFGIVEWSYVPDPVTTYYLNVNAALSSEDEPVWIIQNLPLFPIMDNKGEVQYESTFFNLANFDLSTGDDLSQIHYSWTVNDMIITESLGQAENLIGVQKAEHSICTSAESFDVDFVFDDFYPKDIQIIEIPINPDELKKGDRVQEGDCDCLAGTFARGISWLDQEYGLALHLTAQDIYEGLVFGGVSEHAYEDGEWLKWIDNMLTYTTNQTGDYIEYTVWDENERLKPIEGIIEESGPLKEWLGITLETGVVGLIYSHATGSHIVTVYDMYYQEGKTYIRYRDDEYQGIDLVNSVIGDHSVKHIEILFKDGTYYFGSEARTIQYAFGMLPGPGLRAELYPEIEPEPSSDEEKTWGIFASMLSGSFTHYQGYSEVHGNVVVFGKDPEPIPDAEVTLTMTRQNGSSETLSAVTNQDGEAEVTFTIYSYGTYSVSLDNIEAGDMVYHPEWNAANSVDVIVVGGKSTPVNGFDRLQAFYEDYSAAFKSKDVNFLYNHLHSAVIDLYGADVCRNYLESAVDSPMEVNVDKVSDFGSWDWEVDGFSTPIQNAYTLLISFKLSDGRSGQQETHLALLDDISIGWFTECAETLP